MSQIQWTLTFNEWHKFSQIFFNNRWKIHVFTTRPCRSVFFRCYDKKYYVPPPHFVWNSVVLSWKKGLHAAKAGWKPNKRIAHDTIQQLMLRAKAGWKPNKNTAHDIIQRLMLWAKTGWKPNKNTAQGSALGKDVPTNLRSERAKGRNELIAGSCCAYSAPIS